MVWHQRFFWLLLLFLPTQIGLHFWPEWATVLGRKVDYLAPTIYLTDILLIMTLGWWLVPIGRTWLRGRYTHTKQSGIPLAFRSHLWVFACVFFAIVSVLASANRFVSLYAWLKAAEFILLGWYIVRTNPRLRDVVGPLSIAVFYSSVIAISQFILQHSVGGLLWWVGERAFTVDTPGIARVDFNGSLFSVPFSFFGLRPYATFPHPNVLAGFLATMLPLMLFYQTKKNTMFTALVTGVGSIALVLTFSRSALLVGASAIIFVIARRNTPILTRKRILMLLAVVFFTGLSLFRTTHFSDESVVVRAELNNAAIKLWVNAPVFGVGLGNFLVRLPEALPTRTIYFLQPVHNIYLLLLSEIGIFGVGLIVLWIFGHRQNGTAFQLSLFILLLLGFIDHYALTLQQGQLLLTLLFGFSLSAPRDS
ncbi:MAG: O-antigen ligase family protein [bacterium]|nr:O-antigen ligase family protein [bacterium]